jgi:hypothetical protein
VSSLAATAFAVCPISLVSQTTYVNPANLLLQLDVLARIAPITSASSLIESWANDIVVVLLHSSATR